MLFELQNRMYWSTIVKRKQNFSTTISFWIIFFHMNPEKKMTDRNTLTIMEAMLWKMNECNNVEIRQKEPTPSFTLQPLPKFKPHYFLSEFLQLSPSYLPSLASFQSVQVNHLQLWLLLYHTIDQKCFMAPCCLH